MSPRLELPSYMPTEQSTRRAAGQDTEMILNVGRTPCAEPLLYVYASRYKAAAIPSAEIESLQRIFLRFGTRRPYRRVGRRRRDRTA
jgi:hypothetical protein